MTAAADAVAHAAGGAAACSAAVAAGELARALGLSAAVLGEQQAGRDKPSANSALPGDDPAAAAAAAAQATVDQHDAALKWHRLHGQGGHLAAAVPVPALVLLQDAQPPVFAGNTYSRERDDASAFTFLHDVVLSCCNSTALLRF